MSREVPCMTRPCLSIAVILIVCNRSTAFVMFPMRQLHRALDPSQEVPLVVAGEISQIKVKKPEPNVMALDNVTFRFEIDSVLLGPKSFQHQTLNIDATSYIWPESLVPLRERSFCIFVLDKRGLERPIPLIMAIVPAQKRAYATEVGVLEVQQVLAEQILAQLRLEKSEQRQRDLLLQVAPILKKEQANAVEQFSRSKNPWVKRAALACLIYATVDRQYLKLAAQDVQNFVDESRNAELIADIGPVKKNSPPRTLFNKHYFFLDKQTWTRGQRWSEEEADRHLRILRGLLQFGTITDETRRLLETGAWPN